VAPAEGGVQHQTIAILDFGSQFTQLIARRIRELDVYCEIRPCTDASPAELPPGTIGIVLSGGPASVLGADAPPFDARWLAHGVPVLGICYGMQLLSHLGGGRLGRGTSREYGAARVKLEPCALFEGLAGETLHKVWMSHGDHVDAPPTGFRVVGRSEDGVIAAIASADERTFALQFHPEVVHSEPGAAILERFVVGICGAAREWSAGSFVDDAVARIRAQVGDDHVICALSGGVDSSVVAALIHAAIGDRLHCFHVDTGLQRLGETEAIEAEFRDLKVQVIHAQDRFLGALAGVTDPEKKRKIIGATFIEEFEAAAKQLPVPIRWLAQGTLYPDVIESVSVRGPSATIKSHHNVGGLPDRMNLKLVEPVRELFKDEVRAVGLKLGLSEGRVWRQPFPGPGLAVRCLGDLTKARLDVLRKADAIVRQEIEAAGWDRKVWQAFAVLIPVKTVGVMGDERTYEETCVIRAVRSVDGMTADWVHLPYELLGTISRRICNEVRGINRVVYDISNKPPATIEWE
jgi:GMP synthase (glutamine-hydrolysing)